jgi:hypothetical protein
MRCNQDCFLADSRILHILIKGAVCTGILLKTCKETLPEDGVLSGQQRRTNENGSAYFIIIFYRNTGRMGCGFGTDST